MSRILAFLSFLLFLTSLSAMSAKPSHAEMLNKPFFVEYIRSEKGSRNTKEFICEKPPKPIRGLDLPGYYSKKDGTASNIIDEKFEEHQKLRAPVRTFENTLFKMANSYVESNPPREDIAECVIEWMYTWAKNDAFLRRNNRTGKQVIKWTSGTIANAYMQIQESSLLDLKRRKVIEKWLEQIAEDIIENYSHDIHKASRNNNHIYWAAWSIGSIGIATGRKDFFEWSMHKAQKGINDIQENGVLPLEMDRGKRALSYHIFAAHPLVMLSELSYANDGLDFYELNDGALLKLIALCFDGLEDQRFFEKQTGFKQSQKNVENASVLAWLEAYNKRYKDERAIDLIQKYRPMIQTRLGGDMTLLYGAPLK